MINVDILIKNIELTKSIFTSDDKISKAEIELALSGKSSWFEIIKNNIAPDETLDPAAEPYINLLFSNLQHNLNCVPEKWPDIKKMLGTDNKSDAYRLLRCLINTNAELLYHVCSNSAPKLTCKL